MNEENDIKKTEVYEETSAEIFDDEETSYSYYEDMSKDEPVANEERYDKPNRSGKKTVFAYLTGILAICLIVGTIVGVNSGKIENHATNFHESNVSHEEKATNISASQFVPTGNQLSTEEIAAKVGPAVVGVVAQRQGINYFYQPTVSSSSGSGVIINDEGYIVTNYHVIEGAQKVTVILNTGKECETKTIGYDARSDLAVIKINEPNLTYATFGDSSQTVVGERAVAIGNPLGTELMGTVTQGIISAVNRSVTVDNMTLTVIQTDAAINSGNSGGPLVNAYGEVIGINSVKITATGVEGIGFAIPSNEVKSVADDLINRGFVTGRLMIGVSGTNITEKLSGYYNLPVGFYVNEVYEGYGAYLAGIRTGDVIVKCDGKIVETLDDINEIRDSHSVGEFMEIVVSRNGKTLTFKVKLMEENPEITQ